MIFNHNPIVSNENNINIKRKLSSAPELIIYTLEYVTLVLGGLGLFSFVYFYLIRNSGSSGLFFIVIYLFIILNLDLISAIYVYKDVKKLQDKGINTDYTPGMWSVIVFMGPLFGFCSYLIHRRADYNKQTPNLSTLNELAANPVPKTSIIKIYLNFFPMFIKALKNNKTKE